MWGESREEGSQQATPPLILQACCDDRHTKAASSILLCAFPSKLGKLAKAPRGKRSHLSSLISWHGLKMTSIVVSWACPASCSSLMAPSSTPFWSCKSGTFLAPGPSLLPLPGQLNLSLDTQDAITQQRGTDADAAHIKWETQPRPPIPFFSAFSQLSPLAGKAVRWSGLQPQGEGAECLSCLH